MTPHPGPRRSALPRHRPAFTLVEAVATITILALLTTVTSRILFTAADAYADAAARATLSADLSAALERTTLHLRQIGPKPASSPVVPNIASLTPTSIAFDDDWAIALAGTTLTLSEDGGLRPLLTGVTAFALQPLDASGTPLPGSLSGAECDAVHRLGITLTATRFGQSETLSTRVFLRCLSAPEG